ncbi:TIGR02206 family membrane protein [Vaginisenegalia massiliensis]|uniref:YwaF family protein n=1 Tax=Vaginisenegalia massiliensis TaxID=2058294 RepID=UPI000F52D73A|nr:TIGR02206 family membrane protein [Vaginisenegalia massiliensis]
MLTYFFRSQIDPGVKLTAPWQQLVILGLIISFLLAYHFRKKPVALKIGLCLSAWQQVSILLWYFSTGYHLWQEGLPLYHCRIAMWALIITQLGFKKENQTYFAILGFVGSIVAMLTPAIDPFAFPHITNFSFVFGHYFLFFNSSWLLLRARPLAAKQIIKLTLLINSFILAMDYALGANYAFMLKLPEALSSLPFTGLSCAVLMTLFYCLGLVAFNRLLGWSQTHYLSIRSRLSLLNPSK